MPKTSYFHHAVRCQQWLWAFSRSLLAFCAQGPRSFRSAQKWALSRGARMHSRPDRESFFSQRMLVRGGNSVWQMGEYVFLWRLPNPSHLHYLWIEFSSCLERRLLKRRTTVALSDLAGQTYARIEAINLSRIKMQQTSHRSCVYF